MNKYIFSEYTVFKISLTINLISVIWNIINDCDETYNYWEPLHFLIYGKGFQTWEYSPTYALRSYFYLILYGWPAMILNWLFKSVSQRVLFYLIRVYMAIITSWLELHLYQSLHLLVKNVETRKLPIYCIWFLLCSAGSFISSTAFLPSSFSFYCSIFAFSNWLRNNIHMTIGSVAISAIIGWPFSAAIGIPFAIDIVFIRRNVYSFLKISLFWGLLCSFVSLVVDSCFYGKLTLPCWNILIYNVFGEGGPDLYGTESIWFYVKNYILNFNVAIVLIFLFPLVWVTCYRNYRFELIHSAISMAFAVLTIWNLVFFLQAHKEERFLFPSYPFVAICAGFGLWFIDRNVTRLLTLKWVDMGTVVGVTVLVMFSVISGSRILAINRSFSGSIDLYSHLSNLTEQAGNSKTICLGREWHRFPSHFLAVVDTNFSFAFIRSDFRGQLPAKFNSTIDRLAATRATNLRFNDQNKEEVDRYVHLSSCDFIIDRVDKHISQSINEPNDWELSDPSKWKTILTYKILSPHSVGGRLSIFRSFYVPFLFDKFNNFANYVVVKKLY